MERSVGRWPAWISGGYCVLYLSKGPPHGDEPGSRIGDNVASLLKEWWRSTGKQPTWIFFFMAGIFSHLAGSKFFPLSVFTDMTFT